MRPPIVFALAILELSVSANSDAQVAPRRDTVPPAAVARALSDGARTELLLIFGPQKDTIEKRQVAALATELPLSEVRSFDTERFGAPGARVWIAFVSGVDHWHHYTVAIRGLAVFRLGGFPAPELLAFDRSLGSARGAEAERAALLATVADPNGGVKLRLSEQYRVLLSTGETLARITTESYQEHAYAAYWTRIRYAFLFSEDGALIDWARMELAKNY